jgi:hypothetical protein
VMSGLYLDGLSTANDGTAVRTAMRSCVAWLAKEWNTIGPVT